VNPIIGHAGINSRLSSISLWRSKRGIAVGVQRTQLNPYGEKSGRVGSKRGIALVSRKKFLISRK
jgi:hypothetical protein